jgi:hypothetical protein
MNKQNILVAAVLLLASLNIHASFISGNELKKDLEDDSGYSKGYGFGFVIGVTDAIGILNYVCLPSGQSGVRAGQIREVVLKYLRANPEMLHKPGADLVYLALVDVWPCKKSSDSTPPSSPSPSVSPNPPQQQKPKPKPKEESSPF